MNSLKPHLALIFSNAIWAINYPFYHIVLSHGVSPSAMLFLSLSVAALLALIPLLWSPAERIERGDVKYLVAAAVLSGLMRKGFVLYGLTHTSPIEASIIGTLLPVMALVISVIMGIDRFTTKRVAGIILGMGGVMAIILNSGGAQRASSAISGDISMLLYTIAAGFYMVWLQPIFKKYKPITQMQWIYSLSSIMFLPFAFKPLLHMHFDSMPHHILMITIFVSVIPTFLPNLFLNYALGRVTPTISSIYSYLQPILAIGVSLWLGIGKLHWSTLLFGLIIITGVTLVLRSYSSKSEGA